MRIFAVAGEHSGDVYASRLIRQLKEQHSQLQLAGVAGPLMRAEGVEPLLPMEEFQIMGFGAVLAKLPQLYKQFYQVRDTILAQQPDVTLLVDYPGFNLRLAKSLRRKGYQGKLVHYVCPTVWAWGKGRTKTLIQTLDLLLTIFPFEPDIFSDSGLNARFVGHPLVEALQTHNYDDTWTQQIGIPPTGKLLGLFPGSRYGEVKRIIQRQIDAARRLQQSDSSTQIAVSCAGDHVEPLIKEAALRAGLQVDRDLFLVPRRYSYELMRDAHSALACSGTVNLELALHQTPTVVAYEISTANLLIMWYVLRLFLPHYSIVNILCDRRVFPEFMIDKFSAEDLYQALHPLHVEGQTRDRCLEGCQEAYEALSPSTEAEASKVAANTVTELIRAGS